MVEAPLTFLEVEEEAIRTDAAQLEEAELGEAPEAFDAVDVVFTPGKFVAMVMDAVVVVAAEDEAIVGTPAIGEDVTTLQDSALDDGQKLSGRAVFDHTDIDVVATLVQADDRDFARGSPPALAADPARTEVAFIDLHLAGEVLGLAQCHAHHPRAQQPVKPMHGTVVEPSKPDRGQSRKVGAKILQDLPEFGLGNARVF